MQDLGCELPRKSIPRTAVNKLIARKGLVGSAGFWKAKMSVMSTRTSMFGDFRPGASRWSDTFSYRTGAMGYLTLGYHRMSIGSS
jgi:hypothetical protein